MMAYDKQTWADDETGGTPITAEALNHMEDGIASSSDLSDYRAESVSFTTTATTSITAATVTLSGQADGGGADIHISSEGEAGTIYIAGTDQVRIRATSLSGTIDLEASSVTLNGEPLGAGGGGGSTEIWYPAFNWQPSNAALDQYNSWWGINFPNGAFKTSYIPPLRIPADGDYSFEVYYVPRGGPLDQIGFFFQTWQCPLGQMPSDIQAGVAVPITPGGGAFQLHSDELGSNTGRAAGDLIACGIARNGTADAYEGDVLLLGVMMKKI
jgi:hypothetical protein